MSSADESMEQGLMTADEQMVQSQLEHFLAHHLGSTPILQNLRRLGIGRSRHNWSFDLVHDVETVEPLIMRCDPDGGLVETDRALEFSLLQALEPSALPTPAPRWLDADGRWFGRPALVMRREPGICDYTVLNREAPLAERRALAESFCDLLADVHLVDWHQFGIDRLTPDPGPRATLSQLARWANVLHQDQLEPYPELELALAVLTRHAPASVRTVLVHADFKPGNILLCSERISALLDWELAHLGDLHEDLGWVVQPLRTREQLIVGTWERQDFLARYEQRSGFTVDDRAVRWWSSFASFRTAVMQVSGLRAFVEGRSEMPYRPTTKVLAAVATSLSTLTEE